MLSFIIILLFGLLVAFFAGQNTSPVVIRFANYQLPAVPLYVLVVMSMLIGFVVSFLVSIIDGLSNAFVLHRKDSLIRNSEKKVVGLEQKIHNLEMEIAKLKGEHKEAVVESQDEDHRTSPSLFGRFRHTA